MRFHIKRGHGNHLAILPRHQGPRVPATACPNRSALFQGCQKTMCGKGIARASGAASHARLRAGTAVPHRRVNRPHAFGQLYRYRLICHRAPCCWFCALPLRCILARLSRQSSRVREISLKGHAARPHPARFGLFFWRTDRPAQHRHPCRYHLLHPWPLQITPFVADETSPDMIEIGNIAQPRAKPFRQTPIFRVPRRGAQSARHIWGMACHMKHRMRVKRHHRDITCISRQYSCNRLL